MLSPPSESSNLEGDSRTSQHIPLVASHRIKLGEANLLASKWQRLKAEYLLSATVLFTPPMQTTPCFPGRIGVASSSDGEVMQMDTHTQNSERPNSCHFGRALEHIDTCHVYQLCEESLPYTKNTKKKDW